MNAKNELESLYNLKECEAVDCDFFTLGTPDWKFCPICGNKLKINTEMARRFNK